MNKEQIKERIQALEWEIRCNEEENEAMLKEIKQLEKELEYLNK